MRNDNKTILKNVQEATSNIADSESMVIPLDGKEIILTHDFEVGDLIVKNWLYVDGNNLSEFISTLMQLKTSVREELFDRAIEAIDRYNAEVNMDFPESEIERRDAEMTELLDKIKKFGLYDEFAVYSSLA